MDCIVLAYRPHGVPVNALFLNIGLRVEKSKNAALAWTANSHILQIGDAIAPPLDL